MAYNNFLSDLTIVVPTYNRQDYALRCMQYWSEKGPKVLVIDGTLKPIEKYEFYSLSSNIVYVHMPLGFYERLRASLNLINTKYVILACDDEFYIPSALEKCIIELDNNLELVACIGQCIQFNYHELNKVTGYPLYLRLRSLSVTETEAEDRVKSHMCNYVPSLCYSVSRSKDWKTAWQYTLKVEFPAYSIAEVQFEIFMSFAGKSKAINELMWLRSSECQQTRGQSPSFSPTNSFHDWWINSFNELEKEKLLIIMEDGFKALSNNKVDNLREVAIKGFEAYFDAINKDLQLYTKSNNIMNRLLQALRIILPQKIENLAKFITLKLGFKSTISKFIINTSTKSIINTSNDLSIIGINVDFEQLEKIEKIIIAFHNKDYNKKINS